MQLLMDLCRPSLSCLAVYHGSMRMTMRPCALWLNVLRPTDGSSFLWRVLRSRRLNCFFASQCQQNVYAWYNCYGCHDMVRQCNHVHSHHQQTRRECMQHRRDLMNVLQCCCTMKVRQGCIDNWLAQATGSESGCRRHSDCLKLHKLT